VQQIVFRHDRIPGGAFLTGGGGGSGGGVGECGIGGARGSKLLQSVFWVESPFGLPGPAQDNADDDCNPEGSYKDGEVGDYGNDESGCGENWKRHGEWIEGFGFGCGKWRLKNE